MSPDCRGSPFAFQIFARKVGLFLGPLQGSMRAPKAVLCFGLFMGAKQGPGTTSKRIGIVPWTGPLGFVWWSNHR